MRAVDSVRGPFCDGRKMYGVLSIFSTAQRNCGAKAHSKFSACRARNKVSSVHGRRPSSAALWKRQSIQSTLRPRESLARQAHPAGQKQTRYIRLERALGMGSEAHRAARCALHADPGGGGIFWKHKFEQAAAQRKAAKPFSFRRRKVGSNIQRQTSAAWRNVQPPARAHAAKSAANGDRRAKLCRKRTKCSEQPPIYPDGFAERAAEKIMQAHPGIAGIREARLHAACEKARIPVANDRIHIIA